MQAVQSMSMKKNKPQRSYPVNNLQTKNSEQKTLDIYTTALKQAFLTFADASVDISAHGKAAPELLELDPGNHEAPGSVGSAEECVIYIYI